MSDPRELPTITERVASAPDSPGVYLWRDASGNVLYVGKAKSLRKRMRQYISRHDTRDMIPLLMDQVASFDYVVTNTEVESLVLEKNLIRQFSPPFNVDYRDDKSYPFIAITTGDPFPAIKFTRERHRPGVRYFGPYTDARAARATVETVRKIHPICSAQCVEWKRLTAKGGEPTGKACFDFHVGRGPGPCVGAVSREEYARTVERVTSFLQGKTQGVAEELESRMREAAADLDFERAARFRNRLEAIRAIEERHVVVTTEKRDIDVIGFSREETIAGVHVFVVRQGRVLIGNEFVLDKGMDVPENDLVEGFLLRYYDEASHIPKEVHLACLPDDPSPIEEWLSEKRGSRVTLRVPAKGDKRRILELAERNAKHTLMRFKVRTRYDDERLNAALVQLTSALGLPRAPLRIECYDISTLHGRYSVGSMVVFTNGRPDNAAYRRFRVRMDTPEANDVAMMGEVLRRRFSATRAGDGRFASPPDLVIVDGGKPQLSSALGVFADLGITQEDVPLVALAKREEELFVPGASDPVVLPRGSSALHLVQRVRDEAHRFAVTYHREMRGKAMTASVLDDIPGVGPKRKKVLLKAFGSVKRLREASVAEIASVPGIPPDVAGDIHAALHA